jgi:hypothetical protein
MPCQGSATPIACDAAGGLGSASASWTIEREEDAASSFRLACWLGLSDQLAMSWAVGAPRERPSEAERGAGSADAAARSAAALTLGLPATDPARYAWEPVAPGDPDHMEHARRLLPVVADRQRWQAALTEARRKAGIQPSPDLSATGEAA